MAGIASFNSVMRPTNVAGGVEQMAHAEGTAEPWHGNSNTFRDPSDMQSSMEDSGLAWSVSMVEQEYKTGLVTDDGLPIYKKYDGRYILKRDDTNEPLANVTGRYVPVQNEMLFQIVYHVMEKYGLVLDTAGSLHGGEVVFISAKLPYEFDASKGHGTADTYKSYFLMTTSHGGALAAYGGLVAERTVCQNTLAHNLNSAGNNGLLRHVHKTEIDFDAASENMGLIVNNAQEEFVKIQNLVETLTPVNISRDDTIRLLAPIIQPDEYTAEEIVARPERMNRQFTRVMSNYEFAPGAMPGFCVGVMHALTYEADHFGGRSKGAIMENSLFGKAKTMKEKGITALLQYIDTQKSAELIEQEKEAALPNLPALYVPKAASADQGKKRGRPAKAKGNAATANA